MKFRHIWGKLRGTHGLNLERISEKYIKGYIIAMNGEEECVCYLPYIVQYAIYIPYMAALRPKYKA